MLISFKYTYMFIYYIRIQRMMILLRDWTLHNVECKKMKLESQKELSMKGTKKNPFYLLYTWQKKQVLRLSTLIRIVFYSDI